MSASVHSSAGYDSSSQFFDYFLWTHPDFTSFVAAGNSGGGAPFSAAAGTIDSPANAKNVIAVGAGFQDVTLQTAAAYITELGVSYASGSGAFLPQVGVF